MRVIVTRPRRQGEWTAIHLAERGHEALLLPLTHPVHDGNAARNALTQSKGAIAVTSAEAIYALSDLGQLAASDLSRPLFIVGKATAAEASEAGFRSIFCADGDGIRLADLISDHNGLLQDMPLIYLAGSPRAESLEARLQELGIRFETVGCYRMDDIEPPPEAELRRLFVDGPATAVLFYSRHTTERFFNLPFLRKHPNVLESTRLVCLSKAIAGAVPDFLRSNVEVSAAPDEESLLTLLDAA
jgi:uroporphyrinogen-III synthase